MRVVALWSRDGISHCEGFGQIEVGPQYESVPLWR